jgi:hypothetical protein
MAAAAARARMQQDCIPGRDRTADLADELRLWSGWSLPLLEPGLPALPPESIIRTAGPAVRAGIQWTTCSSVVFGVLRSRAAAGMAPGRRCLGRWPDRAVLALARSRRDLCR